MFHLDGKIEIASGQTSQAGRKNSNDDSLAIHIPTDDHLATHKGIVATIADGVSSADAGQQASQICTERFIEDYYASPDVWTTKRSAQSALTTLNRELYNRGKEYRDAEKGYICTLSILILKSHTAHIFHIGDSRIYRLREGKLELLTHDHAVPVNETTTFTLTASKDGTTSTRTLRVGVGPPRPLSSSFPVVEAPARAGVRCARRLWNSARGTRAVASRPAEACLRRRPLAAAASAPLQGPGGAGG